MNLCIRTCPVTKRAEGNSLCRPCRWLRALNNVKGMCCEDLGGVSRAEQAKRWGSDWDKTSLRGAPAALNNMLVDNHLDFVLRWEEGS